MITHQPGHYRDILRRIIEQANSEDEDEPDVVADFEDHMVANAARALERLHGHDTILVDPAPPVASVEIRTLGDEDRHHSLTFWFHIDVQGRGEDDRTQGVMLEIYPANEDDGHPAPWDDDTAREILAGIPGISMDVLRFEEPEAWEAQEAWASWHYFNSSALQGNLLAVFRELTKLRAYAGADGFEKLARRFRRA